MRLNLFMLLITFSCFSQQKIFTTLKLDGVYVSNFLVCMDNNGATSYDSIQNGQLILPDNLNTNSRIVLIAKEHLIELPKVDYMKDVTTLEISYFSDFYKNEITEMNDIKFKNIKKRKIKRAYYFKYDLGDIITVFYNSKKISSLQKFVKRFR